MRTFSLLAGLALSARLAVASPGPMEHRSFLRQPVLSAEQFAHQIEADPAVAARYEKHFRRPVSEVVTYVRTLRLTPLAQEETFTVYNIDGGLRIRQRRLRFSTGVQVFVDRRGRRIFKRSCGNPLVTTIERVAPQPLIPTLERAPGVLLPSLTTETDLYSIAMPPTPLDLVPGLPALPTLQVPAISFPIVEIATLGYAVIRHRGSDPTPPPVVPEASSLWVLGFGLGGAAVTRRRFRTK